MITFFFSDLVEMFADDRNATRLKHAWIEWRKASGNQYKQEYIDFIQINNDAARSMGELLNRNGINLMK